MSEIRSNTNRIRLAATANPFGARGNKKEKERKLIWLNGHWPPSSSIYWRMSRREQTYVYSGPNLNSPMKIEFFVSCNCWNKIEFWKIFNFNNSPMFEICQNEYYLQFHIVYTWNTVMVLDVNVSIFMYWKCIQRVTNVFVTMQ